ncbi:Transmembrane protein [Salix suchowensis]|nr:Transmembrane protein [Salix suchowensis]
MAVAGASSSYLGVHIRRGDRKASSWKYHGQYLPASEYVSAVVDTWLESARRVQGIDPQYTIKPIYLPRSDSPEGEREFTSSVHAENVFSLAGSRNPELAALASPMDYVQSEFDRLNLPERAQHQGMIVDFALVSGMWAADDGFAPEATICGISSSVCRLSAVALGWDRAFGELGSMGDIDETGKRWVEIDEHGTIVPSLSLTMLFNSGIVGYGEWGRSSIKVKSNTTNDKAKTEDNMFRRCTMWTRWGVTRPEEGISVVTDAIDANCIPRKCLLAVGSVWSHSSEEVVSRYTDVDGRAYQ